MNAESSRCYANENGCFSVNIFDSSQIKIDLVQLREIDGVCYDEDVVFAGQMSSEGSLLGERGVAVGAGEASSSPALPFHVTIKITSHRIAPSTPRTSKSIL